MNELMQSSEHCDDIDSLVMRHSRRKSDHKIGSFHLSSRRNSKEHQIRQDLLQVAIVDIYLNLKKEINKYNHNMDRLDGETQSVKEKDQAQVEKEQKRLLSLGNLVLVDYVRSMIDLLLDYMNTTVDALERERKDHLSDSERSDASVKAKKRGKNP